MTPQLAAKLTIHEAGATTPVGSNRQNGVGGSLLVLPLRRLGFLDGEERARSSLLRREALHRRMLGVADVLAATLALVLVLGVLGANPPALAVLVSMPLVIVLFKLAGLYDRDQLRIVHSTLDEAPVVLQLTGIYALSVTILLPVLIDGAIEGAEIAALWFASFAASMAARMLARWLAGRILQVERCLLIGESQQVDRVREKLASSRAHSAIIASLSLEADESLSVADWGSVRHLVDELEIDRIIIAPSTTDSAGVVEMIRIAKAAGARVSVLPRMLEVVGSAVEFDDLDGLTMLGIRPFGLSRSSRLLKRAFDLVGASAGLLAVAPILALIAVAIRLDSKGPILYRQVRVGRDGRHFRIFKFRSMVANADEQKAALYELNEVGEGMFKITRDPRVTRVGSILRRTSFDELPQLFNVLRGEMSLVGPRPLVTDEDAQVLGLDRSRLHLTPGMTGPWQVLGSRVPMQEMVGIDYLYVAGWSLWLDIKLLLRTVRHVLRSANV
jgi:exopolysaccharide biosynthesis polyprenyl glycosylphosphotransferase